MTLAQFTLGALPLGPLLAAAISVLLAPRARRVLGLMTAAGVLVLAGYLTVIVAGGEAVALPLGGFLPPLGIVIRADGLSVLFLCLAALVGAAVTVYAAALPQTTGERLRTPAASSGEAPAPRWQPGHPAFWPLWLGCWAGLNGVFVAGDLFNTYVALELVGLCAVALVALGGSRAWAPALRYLFVAVLGSLLFLIAVGLLVSVTGSLDFAQVAERLAQSPETHPVALTALALATLGLAVKFALVPLHQWLVPAHAGAASAISPLLSALVIKAALFVLLRCWLWVVGPGVTDSVPDGATSASLDALGLMAWIPALMGAAAVVLGSVMALRQDRLKPLVAYSTVAQAGYWTLLFPVVLGPGADLGDDGWAAGQLADQDVFAAALGGTVALAIGHGLAKGAMFLVAGTFKELYGTDEISRLRSVAREHPLLVMTAGLAAVGLAGLPISLGFTGKWELATAAVAAGHHWILAVLVIGTLLSAAYLLRMIAPLLVESVDEERIEPPARRLPSLPLAARVAPFTLGALTVATGFLGVWMARLLEVGAP
ncbi:complex I subunit 5 family protein [Bogoriella caseilytica]|uniref:Multisubunit sodium/proton antiporter MrpD subunit n=1 Tax=Bogoriella caseilytica TaxID=56055 RepID=A0A3N2BCI1_9MICO|nr:proton-conducting transporter membrane subunit [Bogoriella caseilytica]ROR72973.1 multisubunit sodium/proton antiporter MrpD subunit [Bogoriella caseilytica]